MVEGNVLAIRSPHDAIAAGIGMVTQHFALVRPMSVAENLVLGAFERPAARPRGRGPARGGRIGPIRDPRRSIGARREPVDRAAAAGRDPQGALSRLPDPDPRRADRGARPRARWMPCSPPCARWWPMGWRSSSSATSWRRCAPSATGSASSAAARLVGTVDGQTDERELASMMVGRPSFGVERSADAGGARRRADAAYPRPARIRTPGIASRLRRVARRSCRRDRGGGRGLGQRPDRAGRGAFRDAATDGRIGFRRRSRAGRGRSRPG